MHSSSDTSSAHVLGRVVAVLVGVLGLSCLGYPVLDPDGRVEGGAVFFPVVGVFLLACAVTVWLTRGSRADAPGSTALGEVAGEPALVVRLRPTTPLVMVTLGVAGTVLFLFAVFAVGLWDGGLLFAPLVVLFLALVPDAIRALQRRPRVGLTAAGIDFRGWSLDAFLAWEDVTRVEVEGAGSKWARISVDGRLDAPSWRCRTHRLVLPLDRLPRRPQVAIPLAALDAPARVEVLARDLAARDLPGRRSMINADGVAFLSRSM